MTDRYIATQAGKHLALSVGDHTYHIGEAKFMEIGDLIDKPPGHYILLVVDEPENNRSITFLDEDKPVFEYETTKHAFEAYSASHLVGFCRHCAKTKEEH